VVNKKSGALNDQPDSNAPIAQPFCFAFAAAVSSSSIGPTSGSQDTGLKPLRGMPRGMLSLSRFRISGVLSEKCLDASFLIITIGSSFSFILPALDPMNMTSSIFCLERRTGIERRRYSYDIHIPDRRTAKRQFSSMDRRSKVLHFPQQMAQENTQEHDGPSQR
jgi:hypothetical protein